MRLKLCLFTRGLIAPYLGLASLLVLSACSGPSTATISTGPVTMSPKRATSKPYQINGIWYYPQHHYEYNETGVASFYGGGDGFHGKPTATGETFDKNSISAAHKTLPLPCVAKVTNLENGRVLKVKVHDRGPFVDDRVIDLSRQAARLLGFEGKGLAKVRVETLVEESLALNGLLPGQIPIAPHKTPQIMLADSQLPTVTAPAAQLAKVKKPASRPTPRVYSSPEETITLANLIAEVDLPPAKTTQVAAPLRPHPAPLPPHTLDDQLAQVILAAAPSESLAEPYPLPSIQTRSKVQSYSASSKAAINAPGVYIQAGSFANIQSAQAVKLKLSSIMPGVQTQVSPMVQRNQTFHRVRLGPFSSSHMAQTALQKLINAGHREARVITAILSQDS